MELKNVMIKIEEMEMVVQLLAKSKITGFVMVNHQVVPESKQDQFVVMVMLKVQNNVMMVIIIMVMVVHLSVKLNKIMIVQDHLQIV